MGSASLYKQQDMRQEWDPGCIIYREVRKRAENM